MARPHNLPNHRTHRSHRTHRTMSTKRPAAASGTDARAIASKKSKGAFDVGRNDPLVRLSRSESITFDPSSENLLQDMLDHLPAQTFLLNLFRKKAVHISAASDESRSKSVRNIIQNYMFGLDIRQILAETSSDNVFVWLAPQPGANQTKRTIQSIELQDPEAAYALYQSGHATYCRAPPELEQPLVSTLLRDVGLGCGQYDPTAEKMTVLGRGEVEVFAASGAGHVTDWHTDFQENFTIQLSGQKTWTIKHGIATHPLRGCTPHYRSPDAVEGQLKSARLSAPQFEFAQPNDTNSCGDETTVHLKPGDVFYFPAGMWHKVETVEEGVSINVSLMATNYATLFCQSLQHLLLKDDGWREAVVNKGGCISAVDTLQKLMSTLPQILGNLEENGGARAILPPALLRPPQFQVVGNDADDHDSGHPDEIETGDQKEYEMSDDIEPVEEEEEEDNNDQESSESSESSDDNDNVVDCETFSVPIDGEEIISLKNGGRGFVKNPLATLLRMKDITKFYSDKEEESNRNLYVLNVNYAGNEVMESSVRTILKAGDSDSMSKKILDQCCSLEERGEDPAKGEDVEALSALLWYGYFIPNENN
jgi:hypothetical protein